MALTQEEIIRTLLAARTQILASAWLVVRDAHVAEDIFQTLTVKAIGGGVDFAREAALISWAFVTARHQALNWTRNKRNRAVVVDSDALDILDAEWAKAGVGFGSERIESLEKCLGELPAESRKLLELRYYEERSCGEVASSLRLGVDAVYQRLSRLHRALRQCIERRMAEHSRQGFPETI